MGRHMCCVYGCGNTDQDKESNLSFFSLPGDRERRNEWLKIIGRQDLLQKGDIKRYSYLVCSEHFEKSVMTEKITRLLKQDAMPTKCLRDASRVQPRTSNSEEKSQNEDKPPSEEKSTQSKNSGTQKKEKDKRKKKDTSDLKTKNDTIKSNAAETIKRPAEIKVEPSEPESPLPSTPKKRKLSENLDTAIKIKEETIEIEVEIDIKQE